MKKISEEWLIKRKLRSMLSKEIALRPPERADDNYGTILKRIRCQIRIGMIREILIELKKDKI